MKWEDGLKSVTSVKSPMNAKKMSLLMSDLMRCD